MLCYSNHIEIAVISMDQLLTVPNLLSLSRIVLLPIFMLGFYIPQKEGLILSFIVFVLCSFTDYLDGYFARLYKQTTNLGKLLDPLADKILVSVSILYLIGFDMISQFALIPASITICRELMVTSLRETMEYKGSNFQTSYLAKCKTAMQMIAIACVFLFKIIEYKPGLFVGELLLWLSAILATISGVRYLFKYRN